MIRFVAVVNKSTLISAADAALMVAACQDQVFADIAPAWGIAPVGVTLYTDESQIPADQLAHSLILRLVDTTTVDGALGWHSETSSGVIDGEIAAKPSFDNGSSAIAGEYPVSVTLSHEIGEALVNQFVNEWATAADGSSWSKEISDPVEGYQYPMGPSLVPVSDFVLPAFFDSQAASGPYDLLGKLTAAFTIAPTGYAVHGASPETADQTFGDTMPEWRQALKKREDSRSERCKAAVRA